MTTTKYDWIKFFRPVAKELCDMYEKHKKSEDLDNAMVELAKKVFHEEVVLGKKHSIVNPEYLKKSGIDPFSFIYALSVNSNPAKKQRELCAKILWKDNNLTIKDVVYPYASSRNKLFHNKGNRCKPDSSTPLKEQKALDRLWSLFCDSYRADEYADIEDGDKRIQQTILKSHQVGLVSLTHTLFLINPKVFLPIDDRTLHLSADENIRSMSEDGVRKQIEKDKLQFSDVMESLRKPFPDCHPYEINLFGYLVGLKKQAGKQTPLKIHNKYWLISSNAKNDPNKKDWWKDTYTKNAIQQWSFRDQSCIWTSRPDGGGGNPYPVQEPERGDIMFCRIGPKTAHGIGIVTDNGYSNDWKKDAYISVIWIAAEEKHNVKDMGPQQGLMTGRSYINRYKKAYPKTFELLERLLKIEKMKQDQKNLILTGPPGTGKTRLAKQLAAWLCLKGNEVDGSPLLHWLQDNVEDEEWEEMIGKFKDPAYESQMELVQFHPSYNYEDFVRGIVARTDEGKITYEVRNKILAKLAKLAKRYPQNPYILIIDEINRANLSSVLGELIYALEYRGEPVQALYPIPEDPEQNDEQPKGDAETGEPEPTQKDQEQDDHTLIIPHNLYIIGTMNTADRSVGVIDYAIRRRFIFRKVTSERKIVEKNNISAINLYNEIIKLFNDHLSKEFNQEDMMIGHSYFIPRDVEKTTDLGLRLEYEIKPLLEEYVRDGILLEEYAGDDNLTDEDRKTKKASEKIKELKIS